jgi:hypothetical protein
VIQANESLILQLSREEAGSLATTNELIGEAMAQLQA